MNARMAVAWKQRWFLVSKAIVGTARYQDMALCWFFGFSLPKYMFAQFSVCQLKACPPSIWCGAHFLLSILKIDEDSFIILTLSNLLLCWLRSDVQYVQNFIFDVIDSGSLLENVRSFSFVSKLFDLKPNIRK